jgi:ADP-ribose pyrophosphatase
MKIIRTRPLLDVGNNGKTYFSVHERIFEHQGRERPYYMVTRGSHIEPPEEKRPDAVICVALYREQGEDDRLVLTSEYRVPMAAREISFPAGLIDPTDYGHSNDIFGAVRLAAIREFREETGLSFVPIEISPPNLYSSAGITDESVCIVLGIAKGEPSKANLEPDEDIEVMLLTRPQVGSILQDPSMAFSKVSWPMLWMFSKMGFPF